ncbi:sigma-E factor regulatory protein RseB domain-containing protein [Deinococcus arcticus]|uniref:Transcriptional regulator n=1 Tax=Deinococcus arcticus TaxID=2136176 RepID=A0A2T3WAC1_9DEIO|nr:sigma-E factor regulatory protein RseB domain-containing protein [Deinococcus arcticus]PTA68849.1 transcriptional regulator [Deinococcus arcticus]
MRPATTWALVLLTLLGGVAHAADPTADMSEVLSALKRARTLAARGQVEVTVLFPPREVPTRRAAALPVLTVRPALLQKNFSVTRVGPETVAGRAATVFDLTPKAGQAARWRLWVDTVWNVPLAFEERSVNGDLARRAVFTRVNAAPARQTLTLPPLPAGLNGALARALPGLRLPPGFVPSGVQARPAGREVTLTDGLNTLTLVVSARNVRAAPGVASRRVGGVFVWLVGNLPQNNLTTALSGIRSADETPLGTFQAPAPSNP